ncbi:MAG: DUF5789 family protein [Bdellovibrionota bacterium]
MPNFKNTASSGLRPVLEALRLEEFPSDKKNLYYSVGDMTITDQRGEPIAVRDVLDQIPKTNFNTVEDAIESIREAVGRGGRRAA